MLPIGVQSRGIIHEDAPERGYRRIKQAGLSCVDYNVIWSDIEEIHDLNVFKTHKKLADAEGLTFSQVHGPRYKPMDIIENFELTIAHMERSMQVCEILNAPFMVVHSLQLRYYVGEKKEREYNYKYFAKLGEIAKKYSVVLCVENLFVRYGSRITEGFCCRATDVVELIHHVNAKVGKEVLGACFDIGHANALRQNLHREVVTLGQHLKCLHVHDNDGNGDNHQIPYVFGEAMSGDPCTDWSGFLIGLRDIDYRGAISFEPFKWLINTPGTLQKAMLSYLFAIGKQFAYIIRFVDVLEKQEGKKIILFGAGNMLDTYMDMFGEAFPPVFVVDNNERLWGTQKFGLSICNPEDILKIPSDERCVVISSQYYELIEGQLERMGVTEFIYSEEVCRFNGKPL